MPDFSAFARNVFRAGNYEARDVLVTCDDVDVIRLEPSAAFSSRGKWLARLAYHDRSGTVSSFNPGLRPVRLTRYYDLFLLVCPYWRDVWYANAIEGWKDHCRTSICWVDELWANRVPQLGGWLALFQKFDYVVVGTSGSGHALGNALGRPCPEIQGGVDALRFSPHPNPPARVIDVYNIGRRWPGLHRRLLEAASQQLFYVHDTFANPGNSETTDPAQHRDLYASLAKRSQFFVVAPSTARDDAAGQTNVGLRFFEGSAAGAVLVGQTPDCDAFRRHFDWPQSVIEVRPDGADVIDVISKLQAEPELLDAISRRNAEEALRRHDWVYRWKELLTVAGLESTHAMTARELGLRTMAELIRAQR
jgi:hypothetical protein